jgi:hypothetical protein
MGGSNYQRVATQPTHPGFIQSLDGACWEISETLLNPNRFGAVANGSADDSAAIHAMHATHTAFLARGQQVAIRYLARSYNAATFLAVELRTPSAMSAVAASEPF